MKKIAATACVTICLALVQGAAASADPDTGSGTGGSSGKAPPSLAGGSSGKTPPSSAGATKAPVAAEPTGSLAPDTKSTLAAEVARVDKDMADMTAAVEQIHSDPEMPPDAGQAADAELDVAVREQQIIHEIAVEEGFEPTPDTVPAPSVPEAPTTQPAVTRATVTGDLYAALARLDSRNSLLPDQNQRDAQRAQLAPLLDALRAAEASGDPDAIEKARTAIQSANAASDLAAFQQVTARLNADADRFLLAYTIPSGIIDPLR